MEFREFVSVAWETPAKAQGLARMDKRLLGIRNVAGETPLHYLSIENRIDSVRALVDVGADVNAQDLNGSTPLMHAIQLGYVQLVDYFLDIGASIECKTVDGDTALTQAVAKDRLEIVKKMLKLVKGNINDYFGPVSAMDICDNPNTESRRLVLDLGIRNPYE